MQGRGARDCDGSGVLISALGFTAMLGAARSETLVSFTSTYANSIYRASNIERQREREQSADKPTVREFTRTLGFVVQAMLHLWSL